MVKSLIVLWGVGVTSESAILALTRVCYYFITNASQQSVCWCPFNFFSSYHKQLFDMFCYLSVDFNKNNTHKMIMILPNGPKVREKHLTIMYRSSVCVWRTNPPCWWEVWFPLDSVYPSGSLEWGPPSPLSRTAWHFPPCQYLHPTGTQAAKVVLQK